MGLVILKHPAVDRLHNIKDVNHSFSDIFSEHLCSQDNSTEILHEQPVKK